MVIRCEINLRLLLSYGCTLAVYPLIFFAGISKDKFEESCERQNTEWLGFASFTANSSQLYPAASVDKL